MSRQREPNKHQLSARLAYNSTTPAFLQRMQKQIGRQTGRKVGSYDPNDSEEEDQEAPQIEFETLDENRPAIPVRPKSPRPSNSSLKKSNKDDEIDEEPEDELPQIVVLKEGKHLSKEEAENEKRIAQGLPPLPLNQPAEATSDVPTGQGTSATKRTQPPSMSFSSSSSKDAANKKSTAKRRADELREDDSRDAGPVLKKAKTKTKKKDDKKLLSFADDG
ncbi:hypothetical protein BKA62DRAFT_403339 [Auriculariales sp. MPI-PUGE-AT-0066]|nr:hypothetical protein BKA62DRAFT_403339 [Auriculariales sp. MPI-PUGE-AT-0066]